MGTIERLPINVKQLVEDVYAAAEEDPAAEDRRMILKLPSYALSSIEGDRDLLQLAIYNLLDNAIKFTHSGDRIELEVYQEGNRIVIEVSDSGRGIPEEDLPHVWEELYRSQSVHGIPGSGLGLALVKAIVEKHDGDVEIHSEPGESTTVRIDVPTN
jgi:two-component system, OmpR family, sensor kinase